MTRTHPVIAAGVLAVAGAGFLLLVFFGCCALSTPDRRVRGLLGGLAAGTAGITVLLASAGAVLL